MGPMHLPDLPPDLRFPLLPKEDDALRYSFEVKRQAMGPYIVQRWGWDEALQMKLHAERFAEKPFFRIERKGRAVGTVSVAEHPDHIRFGEFYLLPELHGQGLGSRILRHCLALADARGLPVRLEHLKWNPVGSLYRHHGFTVTGESDIHWFMQRAPGATG
jgi:GNAT superfamily N-acetyltransferase